MSLKPGIGADAMEAVSCALSRSRSMGLTVKDAPQHLRHGSNKLPLGRYLRRRIRSELFGDPACPIQNFSADELQLVRSYAVAVGKSVKSVYEELAGGSPAYQARGEI